MSLVAPVLGLLLLIGGTVWLVMRKKPTPNFYGATGSDPTGAYPPGCYPPPGYPPPPGAYPPPPPNYPPPR